MFTMLQLLLQIVLMLRFRLRCDQCVAKSYTITRCRTFAMFEFTMLSQQTDVHKYVYLCALVLSSTIPSLGEASVLAISGHC